MIHARLQPAASTSEIMVAAHSEIFTRIAMAALQSVNLVSNEVNAVYQLCYPLSVSGPLAKQVRFSRPQAAVCAK